MPNLRIIHRNVADTATLAASTTAGALAAANMLADRKSSVHRSTGTSVQYVLTWAAAQSIGAVVLPACNLTAGATIRARLYSDEAGSTLLHDTGAMDACPGLDLSWWAGTVNANSFAYGALSKTALWLPQHYSARRLVIDLADAGNPAGYIDCARLIAGAWWSPTWGASYGAQAGVVDTSATSRTAAGELVADRGFVHDTLSFDLKALTEGDRAKVLDIFRATGTNRNLLVSLTPQGGAYERDHMVYGKRANATISRELFAYSATRIELEGW